MIAMSLDRDIGLREGLAKPRIEIFNTHFLSQPRYCLRVAMYMRPMHSFPSNAIAAGQKPRQCGAYSEGSLTKTAILILHDDENTRPTVDLCKLQEPW